MKLYHDKPTSQGMENALKRARQMVEFSWTPLRPIPTGCSLRDSSGTAAGTDNYLPAHRPQKGIIYSSVRKYEKYVGSNVSFETFATALQHPDSVVYTRSQHGAGRGMYNFYGTVCSGFAAYVCALPFRTPCSRFPQEPGMSLVDAADLNRLMLCDIVLKTKKHVAIITGIQRDVEGHVRLITVSEETPPQCVSITYSPEEFRAYWLDNGYEIYRYAHIDKVSYTPSPYVPIEGDPDLDVPPVNTAFMADYGDKANYMAGEPVVFSVFETDWTEIRITGADEAVLPVGDGKVVYQPEKPGFYTAVCAKEDAVSQAVSFCVTSIRMQVDKPRAKEGEDVVMTYEVSNPSDRALGYIIHDRLDFMRGRGVFTEDEQAGKSAVLEKTAPGEYTVFVLAENEYGVYRAKGCAFVIE